MRKLHLLKKVLVTAANRREYNMQEDFHFEEFRYLRVFCTGEWGGGVIGAATAGLSLLICLSLHDNLYSNHDLWLVIKTKTSLIFKEGHTLEGRPVEVV